MKLQLLSSGTGCFLWGKMPRFLRRGGGFAGVRGRVVRAQVSSEKEGVLRLSLSLKTSSILNLNLNLNFARNPRRRAREAGNLSQSLKANQTFIFPPKKTGV